MPVRPRHPAAGFTLIELMIVVAILGILASIAIPQYYRSILRARQAETYTMMGMIKQHQFAHYSQHDCFATLERTPIGGPPTPQPMVWNSVRTNTTLVCTGAVLSFEDLTITPSHRAVHYVYECVAEIPNVGPGMAHEFACNALGDLDGDGDIFELVFCSDNNADGVTLNSPIGTACTFPFDLVRVSSAIF